jgi:hypothetical protein
VDGERMAEGRPGRAAGADDVGGHRGVFDGSREADGLDEVEGWANLSNEQMAHLDGTTAQIDELVAIFARRGARL